MVWQLIVFAFLTFDKGQGLTAPKTKSLGCYEALQKLAERHGRPLANRPNPEGEPISWQEFGKDWRWRLESHFESYKSRRNPNQVVREIRRAVQKREPRFLGLKRLGFDYRDGTVEIPAFTDFVNYYEAQIRRGISEGWVKGEDDVIRPGRLFVDTDGDLFAIDYRTDPNSDWIEVSTTNTEDPLLNRMIASGVYPMSTGRAFHDLSHHSGLIGSEKYFEYARVLRHQARRLSYPEWSLINSLADISYEAYLRYFFTLEGLALVPAHERVNLLPYLSEPFRSDPHRHFQTPEIFDHLLARSDKEVMQEAYKLLAHYTSFVDYFGGAGREYGVLYGYRNPQVQGHLDYIAANLVSALKDHDDDHSRKPKRNLRWELARLQVALFESTFLTPAQVFEDFSKPGSIEGTPSHFYFVKTKIMSDSMQEGEHLLVKSLDGQFRK